MIKSVVESLIDEIYRIKLDHGNILIGVSVSRQRKVEFEKYIATAKFYNQLDIQGHGDTPEAALNYLTQGIINQYAPDHKSLREFLDPSRSACFDIYPKLKNLHVHVPQNIEKNIHCGCSLNVGLSVDSDQNLNVTPEFNWCITHQHAHAMRALLEREVKTTSDWIECGDIGIRALMAGESRIKDINNALGREGYYNEI